MRIGSVGVIVALTVILAPPTSSSPRLGAVLVRPDTTACLTMSGAPLHMGEHVFIVLESPPRVVDGWVAQQGVDACNPNAGLDGTSYRLRVRYPMGSVEELGIAVVDPSATLVYADGRFVARTDGARAPLTFAQCASGEGIHLTTWRDRRRTWHAYWYVGYDLEPNCSEEETAP